MTTLNVFIISILARINQHFIDLFSVASRSILSHPVHITCTDFSQLRMLNLYVKFTSHFGSTFSSFSLYYLYYPRVSVVCVLQCLFFWFYFIPFVFYRQRFAVSISIIKFSFYSKTIICYYFQKCVLMQISTLRVFSCYKQTFLY